MPLIDMPVKELEKYMGTNPKPADFEEYWEAVISLYSFQNQMLKANKKRPIANCNRSFWCRWSGSNRHGIATTRF